MAEKQPAPVEKTPRDSLRSSIFAAKKDAREKATINGQPIELHQLSVGQVMSMQAEFEGPELMPRMLIELCYVPGTNEKIFEEGDIPAIQQLPFNQEMIDLVNKVNNMTGMSVNDETKNSDETTSVEASSG